MAHLAFISYSRTNTKHPNDAKLLRQFVEDLRADLEQQALTDNPDEVCFFDTTNIEMGTDWNDELSAAAGSSKVAIALYSPSFFSSVWCGREFQAFLDRQAAAPVQPDRPSPIGVIAVHWIRADPLPEAAARIQNIDDRFQHAPFPPEYKQIGLRQILLLNNGPQYAQVRFALTERIRAAVADSRLPALPDLDLRSYRSAWEQPGGSGPGSGAADSVRKTCFVYMAPQGWDWRPYPPPEPTVGAMAQQLTGELGLRYEEIACDRDMPAKLKQAKEAHVPTLLICDPSGVDHAEIRKAMNEYDERYYINCGLIVPWDVPLPAQDPRWSKLVQHCPQKTKIPPLNHEWTSVTTPGSLKTTTLATVEEIRGRLLNDLASSGARFAKAESDQRVQAAQERGVSVLSAPVVTNVSGTEPG